MTPASRRKALWSVMLNLGLGGTLFFVLVALDEGWDFVRDTWLWPACTMPVTLISGGLLIYWCRREPARGPGSWQLRLADLVGTLLLTGVLLGWWRVSLRQSFIPFGVSFCLLVVCAYVVGLLVASRKGTEQSACRALFACGWVLRQFGHLGLGAVCVVLINFSPYGGPVRAVDALFGDYLWNGDPYWRVLRWSLLALPAGYLVGRLAIAVAPKGEAAGHRRNH